MNTLNKIRMGSGAGYAGDRVEPAIELAEKGNLDYLVFECLAERTIALANQAKLKNSNEGYDILLEKRFRGVLPFMQDEDGKTRFKIISNMGAANPVAAIQKIREILTELDINGVKVAAVIGDDVLTELTDQSLVLDNGLSVGQLSSQIVSANAYLGVEGILEALAQEADIIITGRVADPSLFLAPLIHEFHWSNTDWDKLGKGTLIGHLLECAGQVTGGYFADPGVKDVPHLDRLGFPIAEVDSKGQAVITKVEGSGGLVSEATCKEQLLYEIHQPNAYKTPDVTADFSNVYFEQIGPDEVAVYGGTGYEKPQNLKVTVGFSDGFIGEGQISYGGPNAKARTKLARDIVLSRLKQTDVKFDEIRADMIGVDSLFGDYSNQEAQNPWEVRLRVAARCQQKHDAIAVANEVESLYTNGPYGGGGAVKSVKEVLAVTSTFLSRDRVKVQVIMG
ncbi:acyclic terpene utilization AtuA family protein [Acinetobacter baumannii]|nr:acyclic terpene utilization AtuA family protein [Acinetobacter baumannii]